MIMPNDIGAIVAGLCRAHQIETKFWIDLENF